MKNGGIIISAIVIMFICIYVYSYSFEFFQNLRERRKMKKEQEKEASINERKAFNAKIREEESQKMTQRSLEIKKELEHLAEFRNNLLKRQNEKKKFFRVKEV